MNRKDMIIAAVLVNIGLLVLLVVTGVKRGEEKISVGAEQTVSSLNIKKPLVTVPPTSMSKEESLSPHVRGLQAARKEKTPSPLKAPQPSQKQNKREESSPSKGKPTPALLERMIIVKKGDVLEKIAKTHGVSVERIVHLNRLKTTRLQIGQQLRIPSVSESMSFTKGPMREHCVKEGENPWTIAKQYKIKVEELLRLNHLTEEEAKKLRPGQLLKVH